MEASAVEASAAHPIFAPLRDLLERAGPVGLPDLERLNALAEALDVRTESGRPVRFVAPNAAAGRYGGYELRVFETGCIETRPGSRHDYFNALAWLAFPRTKARINALHVAAIPGEKGRRGRLRDLLTILDEGGAVVCCSDAELVALAREHRWRELFWERRARVRAHLAVHVLGHAVLEQAHRPWPGITCKVLFAPAGCDPDRAAHAWLGALPAEASPALLRAFPVFGLPGWHPGSSERAFYEDARYFRPLRADGTMPSGVGRAAAVRRKSRRAEESPGSAEQNAG